MSDASDLGSVAAARRLARLLTLGTSREGDWLPEELGALFQHQWGSPMMCGECGCGEPVSTSFPNSDGVCPSPRASYRELFLDPHPPRDQLVLIKDVGKAHRADPNSLLPPEISLALYYSAIFAALVRLGERITTLDDETLIEAAGWLLEQAWVDEPTKRLFREGLAGLMGTAKPGPITGRG